MTDKEILQKAINKALKNGFKFYDHLDNVTPCDSGDMLYDGPIEALIECKHLINSFVFSHEFAKAFFGEEKITTNLDNYWGNPNEWEISWKYHLSKMVLEKEPLKYLEKFLKD